MMELFRCGLRRGCSAPLRILVNATIENPRSISSSSLFLSKLKQEMGGALNAEHDGCERDEHSEIPTS